MFGRFGWAEILVIVVLVLILFGSAKIPGMMKNLADGINTFKKEIGGDKSKKEKNEKKPVKAGGDTDVKATSAPTKRVASKGTAKKVAKKPVKAGDKKSK